MNQQIRVPEVRLLDEEGKNLGIVTIQKAFEITRGTGLDLVEVSPKADPPVARIMERGKFLYELEKKERRRRKTQKIDETKTIRFRLSTSEHDRTLKAGQVDKFLKKGYKVQIELQMRGREKTLQEMAREKLQEFLAQLKEPYRVEQESKKSLRGIQLLIAHK